MSWDISNADNWTYKEIPLGVKTLEGGTGKQHITGGWRTNRPIWDEDACTHCMLCWVVCPDSCITVKDQEMTGIDLNHCKGCGVCVHECRFGALELMNEEDAKGVEPCHV